jgi:hypothetical protein
MYTQRPFMTQIIARRMPMPAHDGCNCHMKLLIYTLVFCRYILLNRQLREIKRNIISMPVTAQRAVGQMASDEMDAAARARTPYLHGSSSADVYQPWGDGASLAFQRSRARVPQMRLRGTALWLAIVYHETDKSPHASMQGLHREVLGVLGILKGTYENIGSAPATSSP